MTESNRDGGSAPAAEVDGEGHGDSMNELFDELEELEEVVDAGQERERVRDAIRAAKAVESSRGRVLGQVMSGFDRSDAVESLVGALIFGIPMLVEGGTGEVGGFLADNPPFLAGTLVFTVLIVSVILYVADIQDVRVHEPLFGVVPRKLVGVLLVAGATAAVSMTAWGRVDWSEPSVAVATICVAFLPMAMGSALGDLVS
jgi:uncharacterized membrane protein